MGRAVGNVGAVIRRRRVAVLLLCGFGWAAGVAQAQPDPAGKPIKIVVPYAAGGTADLLGRVVARQLEAATKQTYLIENRPGAGGTVGSLAVAKSAPDGSSLVISGIGSHVIGPALGPTGFHPVQDFTHIALLGGPATVLVVRADIPVKDLAGFMAYAAAHQGGVSWGSPGNGTHGHLIGSVFTSLAKTPHMLHVPYRGAAPAMADLIGGHIQAAFVTYSTANAHIQSGKVRALAITSSQRMAELREVPTFAELGFASLTAATWFAVSGPRGLPRPLVTLLNLQIRQALKQPEARQLLLSEGIETYDLDANSVTQFIEAEAVRWTREILQHAVQATP